MPSHRCTTCKLRAKYDRAPRSLLGRFWRWHIGFCPGWKSYLRDLPPEQRGEVQRKYSLPTA